MHIKCSRQRLKRQVPQILTIVWGCLLLFFSQRSPYRQLIIQDIPRFDTVPVLCVFMCANEQPTKRIFTSDELSLACAAWKQLSTCQYRKCQKFHIPTFYRRIPGPLPALQSSDWLQVKSDGPCRQLEVLAWVSQPPPWPQAFHPSPLCSLLPPARGLVCMVTTGVKMDDGELHLMWFLSERWIAAY